MYTSGKSLQQATDDARMLGSSNLSVDQIASICHAAHRAYCCAIGDSSIHDWENAPDYQRLSCIAGVKRHLESCSSWPSAGHDEWVSIMSAEGWTFGTEKNEQAKVHPCLVPYHELSKEQRGKDWIFTAIVHAIAPLLKK